ncbi:MAG: T9SS type A sorting domain-containing protein [Bacteroidia bacterium]
MYPNPATNQISLEFDLPETKNSLIEIKNVLGQTVKSISNIAFQKGANKIEIDVSEFSNGVYFVQLQNNNQIINQKFIKQ